MFFCDNLEVLYTLVAAGFGFAIVADCPQMRWPGIHYIPLPEFAPVSFGTAYLRGEAPEILRRFLDLVEQAIQSNVET